MRRFDVTIAGELNLDLILYGLPEELPGDRELIASGMMLTLGSSSGDCGAQSRRFGKPGWIHFSYWG